jgi:uncharacterized protein (DUF2147 family)
MMRILFTLLLSLTTLYLTAQDNTADKLLGLWQPSNGKARVKIEKIGSKYYGKIVWLREPNDPDSGEAKTDKNNPDESLRSTPLRGYRILKDFEYTGKKEWTEGTIYDPENGSTYNCIIKLKNDNTLDIRGYVGVKALGRTDVWSRIQLKK